VIDFPFVEPLLQDAVGDFLDHFFQEKPQVAPAPVVGRGDVLDAVRVGAKVVAFAKTDASVFVLAEFTTEHGLHFSCEGTAIKEGLESRRNDVLLQEEHVVLQITRTQGLKV